MVDGSQMSGQKSGTKLHDVNNINMFDLEMNKVSPSEGSAAGQKEANSIKMRQPTAQSQPDKDDVYGINRNAVYQIPIDKFSYLQQAQEHGIPNYEKIRK